MKLITQIRLSLERAYHQGFYDCMTQINKEINEKKQINISDLFDEIKPNYDNLRLETEEDYD